MRTWLVYDWFWAAPFPIVITLFVLMVAGRASSLLRVLGDGQLYFFCAGLTAATLGDLIEFRAVPSGSVSPKILEALGPAHDGLLIGTVVSALAFMGTMIAEPKFKVSLIYASLLFSLSISALVWWIRYYLNMW